MDKRLEHDQIDFPQLITQIAQHTLDANLAQRPVGVDAPAHSLLPLAAEGLGAAETFALFKERFEPWLSGSAGPRYFGFVTGGVTPASFIGDWLTTLYDQNATGSAESIAPLLEQEAVQLFRELLGVSAEFTGSFVTGATMASFVGLALGRQWLGEQAGIDVAQDGMSAMPPLAVLSAVPHSSIYKSLSMLGIGRGSVQRIATLPNREAIDIAALEEALERQPFPCIVVANAGTVNTVDYDNLDAIGVLKARYNFWLHVDGAFGAFAGCSPHYKHLISGIDYADSITIDAHKWLNVPYDGAIQLTKHLKLQSAVFQNAASYLEQDFTETNFVHLTPENSRRLRALPSWFSLMAYGKDGYAEIVERNVSLARQLGELLQAEKGFRLLAPVHMNGVCFALHQNDRFASQKTVAHYLQLLKEEGTIFLTPTVYEGVPAIRVSITNWQTEKQHLAESWAALKRIRDSEAFTFEPMALV